MRELLHGGAFAGFVVLGVYVVLRVRSSPGINSRRAINLFLAYTLAAGFGAGLLQRDMWPFSHWPLVAGIQGPVARHFRLMVVDRLGREHRVDARAWQPFVSDELLAWVSGRMLDLSPTLRDQAAEYLVDLAGRSARRAAAGDGVGYFDRVWGPVTAPYFLLHPRWWDVPSAVPSEPLVGLRLYADEWNLEERRVDPDAVQRTIVYEYRRP